MDDKDKVVTHTAKTEGVGINIGIFPYHVGFYCKRKLETDVTTICPTPHNSPVKPEDNQPKPKG